MSKEQDEIAGILEQFIQRYYNLEVIISPKALETITRGQTAFSDYLGNSIGTYLLEKHNAAADGREINGQTVTDCFTLVTKAFANGFVTQGNDLLAKLEDCRKRNAELMKDIAITTANYYTLQQKYDRLYKMLDHDQNDEWTKQETENEQP